MFDRCVGIDLGITSPHDVCVSDAAGKRLKQFRIRSAPGDLEKLLEVAGSGENTAFVLEACSNAYYPLAEYLTQHGRRVFLVDTQKSYDLRRYYSRHTKTNAIDSHTLSKMPLVDMKSLKPYVSLTPEVFSLRRLTRQRQDFVERVTARINQIRAILQVPFPGLNLKKSTLASIRGRRFLADADPCRIAREGLRKQLEFWGKEEAAKAVFQSALDARAIYGERLEDLSKSSALELRLEAESLEQDYKQIALLDRLIEETYRKADPEGALVDIVGLDVTTAAVVLAEIGSIHRFPNIRTFRAYIGAVPRKKDSGDHTTQGLPMTKNGNRRLRRALFMAATIARQRDPEMAEFFHRLTGRDKHYFKATVAAMNKLAGRIYAVLKRQAEYVAARERGETPELQRYELRSPEGKSLDRRQARAMILERYPYQPKTKSPAAAAHPKGNKKGSSADKSLEAVV